MDNANTVMRKVVVRVLVFEGTPEWVDKTLQKTAVQPGSGYHCAGGSITELPRASEYMYHSPLQDNAHAHGFGERQR